MKSPTLLLCSASFFLAATSAFAAADQDMAGNFKRKGFKCTDTPDGQAIYCVGEKPNTHVVLPKAVDKYEKTLFYAHGLVGVCGNGASGERMLKYYGKTLKQAKAIGLMPWRQAAGNTGFPLGKFVERMDGIIGVRNPLLMAGHSAAGPFFATTLNGTGASLVPRIEKVLLIDAMYGDQTDRWTRVLKRNSRLKLRMFSPTTNGISVNVEKRLKKSFPSSFIQSTKGTGGHCDAPNRYFGELNTF